jgi:hypothetical protein
MNQDEFKKGEIVIYESGDGPKLDVRLVEETIWLTQEQIALLFGTQRPAITKHLKNIFDSGELDEKVVCSILEHTTKHGALKGKTQTKKVKFYNLDAIISVGYRVNSQRATQFRIWATKTLKDHPFVDGNKRIASFLFFRPLHKYLRHKIYLDFKKI